MSNFTSVQPLSPVDERIIGKAREFALEMLAPNAETWDRSRVQPEKVLRAAISKFTPTAIPRELGGFGLNYATLTRVLEELSKEDLGFTCALAVHTNVTVAMSASPEPAVRERFLGGLLSGDAIGAFLLTEPSAGSDATAIETSATKIESGFLVEGKKAWVTNGQNADVMAVFCQTDPSAGAKGIVGLALDARSSPGITRTKMLDLIGSHAMGTTDVEFSSTTVPAAGLAFGQGIGFKAAMGGINVARLGVAAMCNGALLGALETATRYASERRAFGKPIFSHQGLQWSLAEVATSLEASRGLAFQAAKLLDEGRDGTALAAHAKKFATQVAFQGISACMTALGANGLRRSFGLARQLAAARVTECMDGTSQIQNIVIGRALEAATT